MRRSRNLVTFLALGTLCAGCSWFSWLPWVGDDKPDPEAPAELTKYKAEVKLKQLWSAGIGKGLGKKYLQLPPGILADRIYAADAYGHVEARERFKGKRVWQTKVGDDGRGLVDSLNFMSRKDSSFVSGGVGVGEGLVLVGTTNAETIALSAVDGSPVWSVALTSEVLSKPVTGDGLVYLQTSDGRLVALDAKSSSLRSASAPPAVNGRGRTSIKPAAMSVSRTRRYAVYSG